MKTKLFSYQKNETIIHELSGLSKLITFILISSAVMYSYDIRVLITIFIFSLGAFSLAKIRFSEIKMIIIPILFFMLINIFLTFVFSPEYGVTLYGTRNKLFNIYGDIWLTKEQLLYQITKVVKYVAMIPLGLIFILTTHPSQFAASLSNLGINYKISYSVSLALRFLPDIQKAYNNISFSQQARGIDLSNKVGFFQRLKNSLAILVPLVFSTLERVEIITNAMDLRGFGKQNKRTWYSNKKFDKRDYAVLFIALVIFLTALFINDTRFYNPFRS